METSPIRPLSFHDSGRQSPFRRQNSASPATVRAATPEASPTKAAPPRFSHTRVASLSPEKSSPFVRRPSQISNSSDRPTSPFARPTSSLGVPSSPSRQISNASDTSGKDEDAPPLPRPGSRLVRSPTLDQKDMPILPPPTQREETPVLSPPSQGEQTPYVSQQTSHQREIKPSLAPSSPTRGPSPFDGATEEPAPTALPSQSMLRPSTHRIPTSSTAKTVHQPSFTPSGFSVRPRATGGLSKQAPVGGYNQIPPPLLRTMRESFEVLDSSNSGSVNSAAVKDMLEQLGMDNSTRSVADFFLPNAPSTLNLARYLDTLSAPLAELSHPDELQAAFEAFDLEDSGQIDLRVLREAVLGTAPEEGERLGERDVDGILGEFAARRQFGGKGLNVGREKGEIFRYRDFMAAVTGGSGGEMMHEGMVKA